MAVGWIEQKRASEDPLFHAVVDKATGVAGGRQTLMRITPEHGVIEIGNKGFNRPQQPDVTFFNVEVRTSDLMDPLALRKKHGGRLPQRLWPVLVDQVEGAIAAWRSV